MLLKKMLKKILPTPIWKALSKCNYRIRKRIKRDIGLFTHTKAFKRVQTNEKTVIIFIAFHPQGWNSLKSVYEAALKNSMVEAYLVVTPGKSVLSDGSVLKAYDYFSKIYPNSIDAYENGKCFDLRLLKPDIIFRQTPYDQSFPKKYSIKRLAQIAKTCYIPYNFNYTPRHLHIEYNHTFLSDIHTIFSDCRTNAEYCEEQHREYYPDLHVRYHSFPRFDLIRDFLKRDRKSNPYTFTWIPRWCTDNVNNDGTSFFDYKDLLVDYFANRPDFRLIIRPHPLMWENFVKIGIMSEQSIGQYKDKINSLSNVFLDNNMDYLDTFSETDVLIADVSSLNYEFYLTGRPIIFCSDSQDYNRETEGMRDNMYYVANWDELRLEIEKLMKGEDVKAEDRYENVKEVFRDIPMNIGESIVADCIKIAKGETF